MTGLPKFKVVDTMQKICEACQFGNYFENCSCILQDVIKSVCLNVWGPTKTMCMGGCSGIH